MDLSLINERMVDVHHAEPHSLATRCPSAGPGSCGYFLLVEAKSVQSVQAVLRWISFELAFSSSTRGEHAKMSEILSARPPLAHPSVSEVAGVRARSKA